MAHLARDGTATTTALPMTDAAHASELRKQRQSQGVYSICAFKSHSKCAHIPTVPARLIDVLMTNKGPCDHPILTQLMWRQKQTP